MIYLEERLASAQAMRDDPATDTTALLPMHERTKVTQDRQALIREAIHGWRDSLVNLTATNRLLNFKPRKTSSVPVIRPEPSQILDGLEASRTFFFRSLIDSDESAESTEETAATTSELGVATSAEIELPPPALDRLDTTATQTEMQTALMSLLRRANAEYLDRGLWVLYLAFGTLTWSDEDGSKYTSPLLLVPVSLVSTGPRQPPYLVPSDEDRAVNPALTLKLAMNGIELPVVGDLDELSLEGFLHACESAVASQPGWQVANTVHLSYFSFAKEAMYRDLLDNEELIADHLAIGGLATGGRGEENADFLFDEIPDERIDEDASPENAALVLDADSSQRACIAAAVDNRSFVMDGPPGTGKSQTIANIVGALLHAGKTVLFVSEKAAALEVVKNRLTEVGLGSYLLELHSHKATRKEVAQALGAALDNVAIPPAGLTPLERNKARERREQLNSYAEAMNISRQPLGLSLHAVLGMIASAPAAPVAPLTGVAPSNLSIYSFSEVKREASDLARAWRPASQGSTFTWRGVTDRTSFEARLFQARSALEQLRALHRLCGAAADAFALHSTTQSLVLAEILLAAEAKIVGTPDAWFTAESLDAIQLGIARLNQDLERLAAAEDEAARAAQTHWTAIPATNTCPVPDMPPLTDLNPVGPTLETVNGAQAHKLSTEFAAGATFLRHCQNSLDGFASTLGVSRPVTFNEANDVLDIAALAGSDQRPHAAWLTTDGIDKAVIGVTVLEQSVVRLTQAEAAALSVFQPRAVNADVASLEQRFRTTHHGVKKLLGEYRADKRAVAELTQPNVEVDVAQNQLGLLVECQQAAAQLRANEVSHGPALGAYFAGRTTDFSAVKRVLEITRRLVTLTPQGDLSAAADHISFEAKQGADLYAAAGLIANQLRLWRDAPPDIPNPSTWAQLAEGSIQHAADWLATYAIVLNQVAIFTEAVSTAVGRTLTLAEARQLSELRRLVDEQHAIVRGRCDEDSELLGSLYDGRHTDMQRARSAVASAASLRTRLHGTDVAITLPQVKALTVATPSQQLYEAAIAWSDATAAILAAFDASRTNDLSRELADFDEAADLLRSLESDAGGQDEWFVHQEARARLADHGLDVAVEFCIAQRVEPQQVPTVIETALLREWVDHILALDPALRTVRAEDRNALVDEYRQLDRALVAGATADIIEACNARRPRNELGQTAVIRREAEKKKKHMPVRLLIDRSRGVTQAIKPCFMMSPLAVSQYLPPDMHFDVVVFDEASQVPPGEAINCIYRGSALITAGDQKQLPPTNFFAGTVDDGDDWDDENETASDFESILDLAKASGIYKSLTLKWHYRSRHEALIAFSNQSFYEGKLITFPGAEDVGPNVGVELFSVPGVYRRGSTRDNPVEADVVADRVIHHYDTRPQLTLGVATFSEAQAVAVLSAVERARIERPDLERFFESDRLNGFFVKNLESVQGDERDVMIFSLGYGPDEHGKITMNFGPLNRVGGWRRLNVAITRARYRNEIISSITAGDITASATSDGIRHLKRYLDYAARGLAALALDTTSGGDAESPFEESVLATIRSWGYDATPQVGAAGYRIDMAIRHPDHHGVYVLGIECDGLQYHSSKVARDRDRLREQVLRGLGWNLHRIWGTAWYRNRSGEMERLRLAIQHAVSLPINGLLSQPTHNLEIHRPAVSIEAATFDDKPSWTTAYARATVAPLARWTDPSVAGSQFEMVSGIESVAATEAPVHISLIYQRLRETWNIGRVGARIKDNIDAAIELANVVRDGDFVLGVGRLAVVRTPTDEVSRTVDQVHDEELGLALTSLVRDTRGITPEELTQATARIFGWSRRGPDINSRLDRTITTLLSSGALRLDAAGISIPD